MSVSLKAGSAADRIAKLENDVELLRLRLRLARLTAIRMSCWVDENEASLDLVIDDVLARWRECERAGHEPADLSEFWSRYADRVESAPSESDDDFRPEFCPAEPGWMDTEDYYRAVWRTHLGQLRSVMAMEKEAGISL
jgi:hypothetical protein